MNKTILSILVVLLIIGAGVWFKLKHTPVQDTGTTSEYEPTTNPSDFSTSINNPYFVLTPGTKFTYQSKTKKGVEHSEFYITKEKKAVLGVAVVVVSDKLWLNGDLTEDTQDWFAQDKDGTVWYFGESTSKLAHGKILDHTGSWEAGVNGAKPGIIMEGNPKVGDSYREEYLAGQAEDRADIVSRTESVSVPFGTFTNCLKTKNYTMLDPGKVEYKYYCTKVGNSTMELDEENQKTELISVSGSTQPLK
jgi:hypothetical protein